MKSLSIAVYYFSSMGLYYYYLLLLLIIIIRIIKQVKVFALACTESTRKGSAIIDPCQWREEIEGSHRESMDRKREREKRKGSRER